ncbi:hypothetical protein F4821DRAFT_20753 [Hypoxylon rubiginosum]|uniref:Uncharacterized protein n=1 Tax=Hypoxylon rubiginosum TaxID=110542 RepID=A0ACC0DCX7_9PEZI|nr:hypothetical protein F4821DRAFT_20753 [Hypoxylon rubiginosum]
MPKQTVSSEPNAESLGELDQYLIPHEALERTLQGVIVATKLDNERQKPLKEWLSQQQPASKQLFINEWLSSAAAQFSEDLESHALLDLIIGIAYMRARGRQSNASKDPRSLKFIWSLVHRALLRTTVFKTSRSAGGFIFVPLCSLIKDGAIDELWRLHVWLPDGIRGSTDFKIHDHNAYGQSWVLTGEGTNHRWLVEPADEETATHSEYRLAWNDGKKCDSNYKTHQVSATVTNVYKYLKVTHLSAEKEQRDMTYAVSQREWHSSEVAPEAVFATLFFFDAYRGANRDAAILGPKDRKSSTTEKAAVGITPGQLIRIVELTRTWEDLMTSGKDFIAMGHYDKALGNFNHARLLCEEQGFPNRVYYEEKTESAIDLCRGSTSAVPSNG